MDSAYEFKVNYSQEYQKVFLGELASQGGLASMELTAIVVVMIIPRPLPQEKYWNFSKYIKLTRYM